MIHIKKITMVSDEQFLIEWTDGVSFVYTLSIVQSYCPCTRCKDSAKNIDRPVFAKRLYTIGAYAIKIEFTSGCSRGIYPINFFRELARA